METHSNNTLVALQLQQDFEKDPFALEIEVLPIEDLTDEQKRIKRKIDSIEDKQALLEERLLELNSSIDKFTSHADGIDYTVAAACGILCGMIDSFFVGEIDFPGGKEKANKIVNDFVERQSEAIRSDETVEKHLKDAIDKANAKGHPLSQQEKKELEDKIRNNIAERYKKIKDSDAENGTNKALARAITKLEEHFKLPLDNIFKGTKGINSASHHLDDMAHHPTFLGLMAAIFGTILRSGILVDKNGKWHFKFQKQDFKEWIPVILPLVISGILTFVLYVVKFNNKDKIDESIPKPIQKIIVLLAQAPAVIRVLDIINNWLGHLASDIAGSKNSPGKGMGIPGIILSSLKELSGLLGENNKLASFVDDLYQNHRIDFRAEFGFVIGAMDSKQWIPVLGGDVLVRTFYFIRRLIEELKGGCKLRDMEWKNVIPFGNRTISKMMLVESGVFEVVDIADAAIRSAIKNGTPENPLFWKDFILRINIFGVGRFAIAVGTDVSMGVKRNNYRNERIKVMTENTYLQNAKIQYKIADCWIEIEKTQESMKQLEKVVEKATQAYMEDMLAIEKSIIAISETTISPEVSDIIKDEFDL